MTSHSSTPAPATQPVPPLPPPPLSRLAVAVDGEAGGRDAFALARSLAGSTDVDLVAMTVIPDLSLIAPWAGSDPMQHDIEQRMRRMRDTWHPRARIAIDRDRSVARGLIRMAARHQRELLVVGSGHRGEPGQVSLSGNVRQLIDHLPCPLVIAPRGLAEQSEVVIRRIAVGVDGSESAGAALADAARVASTTGAELIACGVVDGDPPRFGWPVTVSEVRELWAEALATEAATLESTLREGAATLGCPVSVEVRRGLPADVLTELSAEVDLLVLGSRRWGTVARLVLGGTGEALAHRCRCPLMITPRPHDDGHGRDE